MLVNWDDMSTNARVKFIADRADRIFVRAKTAKGWESVALVELSDDEKIRETRRLAQADYPPFMIKKG